VDKINIEAHGRGCFSINPLQKLVDGKVGVVAWIPQQLCTKVTADKAPLAIRRIIHILFKNAAHVVGNHVADVRATHKKVRERHEIIGKGGIVIPDPEAVRCFRPCFYVITKSAVFLGGTCFKGMGKIAFDAAQANNDIGFRAHGLAGFARVLIGQCVHQFVGKCRCRSARYMIDKIQHRRHLAAFRFGEGRTGLAFAKIIPVVLRYRKHRGFWMRRHAP